MMNLSGEVVVALLNLHVHIPVAYHFPQRFSLFNDFLGKNIKRKSITVILKRH